MLLDLLAGWADFVDPGNQDDGNYPDNYHAALFELYQKAGADVLKKDFDAAEFIKQNVLPLLEGEE